MEIINVSWLNKVQCSGGIPLLMSGDEWLWTPLVKFSSYLPHGVSCLSVSSSCWHTEPLCWVKFISGNKIIHFTTHTHTEMMIRWLIHLYITAPLYKKDRPWWCQWWVRPWLWYMFSNTETKSPFVNTLLCWIIISFIYNNAKLQCMCCLNTKRLWNVFKRTKNYSCWYSGSLSKMRRSKMFQLWSALWSVPCTFSVCSRLQFKQ